MSPLAGDRKAPDPVLGQERAGDLGFAHQPSHGSDGGEFVALRIVGVPNRRRSRTVLADRDQSAVVLDEAAAARAAVELPFARRERGQVCVPKSFGIRDEEWLGRKLGQEATLDSNQERQVDGVVDVALRQSTNLVSNKSD